MKKRHTGGPDRHFLHPDHPEGHQGKHRRHGRHGGRRLFDYGELRLLLLAMIAERPRHGYELIKEIEERFGGAYSPSPGVIYPTLSWLDDMGYAAIEPEASGRKLYRITSEGEAFLVANRTAADELLSRMAAAAERAEEPLPEMVADAIRTFKLALRLRLKRGSLDDEAAGKIAAALLQAAQTVEQS
ncbi:PadR family transcriptional regulator (plasmid) [Agrobacterium tumefaciens]|uniref:PadR family transcriptional regulator n=1 Tax=Agrobacterium tumefaciens TaxID=358 RepID=A0AAP9J943_AGRTU|nr:PadR family transcriptional regulator [Agrobacterium tumefaciens]NSZ60031.1 PadR family transcriptional regulator [Agrobacterium tumefaciens]QDY97634.1 PadR family transcriptional regulator [Agrobacterium tumefaciens]UXS12758.1 PadR family transcriptional regulator [Agrobacterium tumefaciens]UXS20120.1 PadR family transcriptional regulator [Agrobacterium tumefaciens]UXS27767.1 PadR family transcriptional regulator [Agrobacterium tumefaciens]